MPHIVEQKPVNSDQTSALTSHFSEIELIGEGMTSKVFKALDKKTGTTVAIKVLNPHLKTDKISLERFKREIQITRAIHHPNVISIYDLAVRGDLNYLVMEFIDGMSLKDYIKLHSPLSIQTVVSVITQLLDALSLCHSKSVIHRDLKPQNIMITADGNIKILDFGIARMTALSDLTQVGTSLGSPEYMAPELFAASAYEPRSDLYAIGIIAFELLSGVIPFQGDTLAVIFNKHFNDQIPALSNYRKDIPQWLEQIIFKLLAKKSYQRYQSANDVRIDLNAKKVISSEIPVFKTRPCFACGEQMPADAFVCFSCGDNGSERYSEGDYYIICDSPQDPEKLRCFFMDYTGKDIVCPGKRGTVIAANVDEVFVNTIKKAMQQYGIHVVSQGSVTRNLGRVVSLLFRLPIACIITIYLAFIIISFSLGISSPTWGSLILLVFVLFLLGWWVKTTYIAIFPKPVLVSKDFESGKLSEMRWFGSISPLLKVKRNEDMQKIISQTLERLWIFEKHAKSTSNRVRVQMRELVVTMLPIANHISHVKLAQQNVKLAKLMREYYFKMRNDQDTSYLESAMQRLFTKEENYAALVNRFFMAMALFNRLIGMALVFDRQIEEAELEVIREGIGELRQDVDIWKRIKADLEHLPRRAL